MRPWCIFGLAVVAIVLAGCGPKPLASSSWPETRPLAERLKTYRPPAEPDADAIAQTSKAFDLPDPTGELTLRQAMALSLARNPKLRAFGWDVRQAEARTWQAGLWTNPEIETEFENFGGTNDFSGTQSLETKVRLRQTFPLGGDVERRRELAAYESQLAGWDYEAARLQVLTEVTQRYIMLLAARRRVQVAEDALQLAEQVVQTTDKRIEAGDAPPIEASRASVPLAMSQVAVKRAEREWQSARKRLALMWASNKPSFELAGGSLEQLQPPPSAERLVTLINQNPHVARWATEISARRAEAELAEAEAIPDLTGQLGLKHEAADDAIGLIVGISLPLPIFDRRQGDILAARLGQESAKERRREAEMRLESMLSEAYARLAGAYDEAVAIRDVALPPAQEAFDLTHRAFENGDLTFLDLLDAERTLVDLRMQYLDALAEYHRSIAEIEGLIGQSLDSLGQLAVNADRTTTP